MSDNSNSTKPRQTVPAPSNKGNSDADLYSPVMKFLYLTLFGSDRGQAALMKAKEADLQKDGQAVVTARNDFTQIMTELFRDSLTQSFFGESVKDIKSSVDRLTQDLEQLLSRHSRDLLEVLLPHGLLRQRFICDHPNEKAAIAKYASKNFLSPKLHCFIQASTMAIHLGNAIAENPAATTGCLFYTNSIVFPLTVLRDQCPHAVYSFCGSSYDPMCGGWLFPPHDAKTSDEFRHLFLREEGRLSTAFLMPISTSISEGPAFLRNETAWMARIAIDHAQKIVIMSTADRICETPPQPPTTHRCLEGGWGQIPPGKVVLIVAGETPAPVRSKLCAGFAEKNIDVHWHNPATNSWLP